MTKVDCRDPGVYCGTVLDADCDFCDNRNEVYRKLEQRLKEAEKALAWYADEWNQINPKQAREYFEKYEGEK